MFLQFLCNNLDPVHRIQTKFGMDILLDPRNKPAKEFFIFPKIQDGRQRSKNEFRPAGGQKFATRYTFSMFSWNPTFNIFFLYEGGKSPADKFALKNAEFCLVSKTFKYVFVRIF